MLSLAPGSRIVIANGRALGALRTGEKFVQEDFGLLEKYFVSTLGDKIVEILDEEGWDFMELTFLPFWSDISLLKF